VRRLQFPEGRIVGFLSWVDSYNEQTGPVHATGTVEVPVDQQISLHVMELLGSEPQPGGGWTSTPAQRPSDLSFLRELPKDAISSLYLGWNTVPKTFAAVVSLAPGLKRLHLANTMFNDGILYFVAQLDGLIFLDTFGNHFSDEGVQQLRSLRRLQQLYLEEESLSVAAFDFVTTLPDLTTLGVWDVRMTPEEQSDLQARLPGVYLC
jgi:hypothetical protein